MTHLLSLFSALCLALLPAACSDNGAPEPERPSLPAEARRTVLVYMCAQNTLGSEPLGSCQRKDSAEIVAARGSLAPHDRLLLFIDDADAPRLYEVAPAQVRPLLLKRWTDDFCSASPARFGEVLREAAAQCPAEEDGLVMWSHSDGWLPPTQTDYAAFEPLSAPPAAHAGTLSFGIDSGPEGGLSNRGAQMAVEDMAEAIAAAGIRLRYVFFDSCLMQNVEVAYALRHVADLVVGAPMTIPGNGAYYTHLLARGLFAADPADIVDTYVADVADDSLRLHYDDFGLVLSAVRTDRLEALAEALRDALPQSALADSGDVDMTGVLNYQAYAEKYYYRPHNFDALQALRRVLAPADTARVFAALEAAVVRHAGTQRFWIGPYAWDMQEVPVKTDDFRGLSLFIPQNRYSRNARQTVHGDLNAAFRQTEWYRAAGFEATGW